MADHLEQAIKDGSFVSSQGITVRVYLPDTPEYQRIIVHRFPNGISKVTVGVVEPCSESELTALMEILAERRIPFGIKSGGHISIPKLNPFDRGIIVSMRQFNHIFYDSEKKTLEVGAGANWREVYEYLGQFASDLAPGVVGGDPHVGVSGWLLGGGYSLVTSRFGLGIDNVVEIQVLLPGARAPCDVSYTKNPELFRALKGGGHNFGIITRYTLRVYDHLPKIKPIESKQYSESESHLVKDELVKFIQNETRPEAVLVALFRHDFKDGKLESVIPMYLWHTDGSPASTPGVSGGESHVRSQNVFQNAGVESFADTSDVEEKRDLAQFFFRRGGSHRPYYNSSLEDSQEEEEEESDPSMSLAEAYDAFSLRHLPVSLEVLQTDSHFVQLDASFKIEANTFKAGDLIERKIYESVQEGNKIDGDSLRMLKAGNKEVVMESVPDPRGRMASIMVSTYTRTLMDEIEAQAKVLSRFMEEHQGVRVSLEVWPFHKDAFKGIKREDSAWPHEEGAVFGPLVGWFEWSGKENDQFWLEEIEKALRTLHSVALEENCTTEELPTYINIALENTPVKNIYRDHFEQLKALRRKYDPKNVMGMAKGFVIDIGKV